MPASARQGGELLTRGGVQLEGHRTSRATFDDAAVITGIIGWRDRQRTHRRGPGMKLAAKQGMIPLHPPVQPTSGEQESRAFALRPVVLIVDDDGDARILMSVLLHANGYAVMEACDGADALAQLCGAARLPAAILTDLAMPGVDGWRFIELLREDVRWSAIPIIVISSSTSLPTGVCCLRKPTGGEQLMRALTRIGVAASPV
jgi:CheY-like chemotaxis protein